MKSKPVELTIDSIFEKNQYIIPLYQRNYTWGEAQVTQLIRDVWDKAEQDQDHYYIGTLVVHRRQNDNENHFETIDGQQRLTTINILISVLKNDFEFEIKGDYSSKLKFDSRKRSSETLKYLRDGLHNKPSKLNSNIQQAYFDIRKEIKTLSNSSKLTIPEFIKYLTTKVILLRVEVPKDTDLNHYFEIMNNRGEQLEKHEVLKAMFLEFLKKDKIAKKAFSKVWDACSNMDRYIQYGFKKNLRVEVFGKDWNHLPADFNHIENSIEECRTKKESSFEKLSFSSLLQNENLKFDNEIGEKEKETRFNSPINFPNFLLHVLRIHLKKDIPLDDKRLIPVFKKELEQIENFQNPSEFAKEFGYSLLKCKFLFDNYILKREYIGEKDNWSLKRIKLGENQTPYYANSFNEEKDNRQCLMLLSMLHVSFPQMIYKHWLNGVLNYLYHSSEVDAVNYVNYLESLSEAFYFDRFIKEPVDYYDIIFNNNSVPENTAINKGFLHKGTDVQNFIFNRLDYLIWRNQVIENREDFRIGNINEFEFSFRSSVEHFYPQNPKPGADLVKGVSKDVLDNFGNLCLISRSKNSELSNYSPKAKAEHYSNSTTVESLKQQLMIKEKDNWDETAIKSHEDQMIKLLSTVDKNNLWKNIVEEKRSVETI